MIIVTGGAGFIGSNIVKGLNDRGIDDILVVTTSPLDILINFSVSISTIPCPSAAKFWLDGS